jgi:hypothetical protein
MAISCSRAAMHQIVVGRGRGWESGLERYSRQFLRLWIRLMGADVTTRVLRRETSGASARQETMQVSLAGLSETLAKFRKVPMMYMSHYGLNQL